MDLGSKAGSANIQAFGGITFRAESRVNLNSRKISLQGLTSTATSPTIPGITTPDSTGDQFDQPSSEPTDGHAVQVRTLSSHMYITSHGFVSERIVVRMLFL